MIIRPRSEDLGIESGILERGINNSITDVPEVSVGHITLVNGDGPLEIGQGPIRTGVTVILPHQENIFQRKVTGAVHVLNGFGKAVGFLQVAELGEIESPIGLTSTLSIWNVANGLIDYLSAQNPGVYSFNPLVGECNDGFLNDIVGRHVNREHVLEALSSACSPNTEEGNVGAGTGMTGFGWKGGIGTSSRTCIINDKKYTLGVMTLTNTGDPREFRINGTKIGKSLQPPLDKFDPTKAGGSIMMVVATDAPIDSRQLTRVGKRAALGLARAGGIADHSSGDFIIAFSNSTNRPILDDTALTPLFRGAVEATDEAIVNSVLRAETLIGRDGNTRHGIPIDEVKRLIN